MPSTSRGNGSYYLDFSDHVAEQLGVLQRLAVQQGQGTAFALAFRRIAKGLRHNPLALGEPLYQLTFMGLQVRTVVVAPLVIDFAVDERRAIVYLKGCKLLSARAT